MLPRYRNVSYSYLAFMSPTYLYGIVLLSGNEMQTAFFFVFLLVGKALKNDVGLIGLIDSHHLDVLVVLKADDLREVDLAYFALKLSEVI